VKMMAWDLSANYSFELMRHDMLAAVGPERTAELLPPYPRDGLTIVPKTLTDEGESSNVGRPPPAAAATGNRSRREAADWSDALPGGVEKGLPDVARFLRGGAPTEALGSNNWVVDGTLTASGKPLLANDPHLGTHVPSLWYLAHLTAGDFDLIGATLP